MCTSMVQHGPIEMANARTKEHRSPKCFQTRNANSCRFLHRNVALGFSALVSRFRSRGPRSRRSLEGGFRKRRAAETAAQFGGAAGPSPSRHLDFKGPPELLPPNPHELLRARRVLHDEAHVFPECPAGVVVARKHLEEETPEPIPTRPRGTDGSGTTKFMLSPMWLPGSTSKRKPPNRSPMPSPGGLPGTARRCRSGRQWCCARQARCAVTFGAMKLR